MSEEFWNIHAYVIPASHVRGFSRGVRDEKAGHLRLAVKQYVPKQYSKAKTGSVTLIMAHGIGTTKESYEPFFDELLRCGLPTRAIWAMDVAHHGASYSLNEKAIGDEPHWFDSSRDMLQMINHFQELMPPPLIAIGQSWGGITIVGLALIHPRLFAGLVLLETPFGTHPYNSAKDRANPSKDRYHIAVAMSKRQDLWPSLQAARKSLRATPYYKAFDSRVFERTMKYDLRPAPPERCAEIGFACAVTLTTPKSMEAATMMRPDPPFEGYPEEPDIRSRPDDINTTLVEGFYRGELLQVYRDVPKLLPSTLVVWAGKSFAETNYADHVTNRIGTGYGGNGGIAAGRVQRLNIPDISHLLPLENPEAVAKAISGWLQSETSRWHIEQEREQPPFNAALHPEWTKRIAKL